MDDDDAVEDIVHDLFIKLWTNRENIQINQQFKSYIYRAHWAKIHYLLKFFMLAQGILPF